MAESHVVSALKAKRAELAGEADAVERRLAQLRADLVHVDAVLRMFDPAAEPDSIPAKRPYRRREWFSDGELPRRILDALRGSETAPERHADCRARDDRQEAGRGRRRDAGADQEVPSSAPYLRRQSGALVQAAGRNGRDGLWRICG